MLTYAPREFLETFKVKMLDSASLYGMLKTASNRRIKWYLVIAHSDVGHPLVGHLIHDIWYARKHSESI